MLPPIYSILSAASAVSAIVGNRIYPHADAPLDDPSGAAPQAAQSSGQTAQSSG